MRGAVLDIGTELLININVKAAGDAVEAHATRLGTSAEQGWEAVTDGRVARLQVRAQLLDPDEIYLVGDGCGRRHERETLAS